MNISPQTNLSSPVSTDQKTISTDSGAVKTGSRDLASVSASNPSVKVSLSATDNAVAAANTKVPPLYSRPTVSEINQARLRTDELSEEDARVTAKEESSSKDRAPTNSASAQDTQEQDAEESKKSEKSQGDDQREAGSTKLTDEELEVVDQLKARDQEVRAHEQAHKSVGGQYTGAISFDYQSGPDGKRYAVGGEVPIDVSKIPDNPEATISKMQTVKAAALAPAEPSTQDRAVASEASRLLAEAQSDLVQEKREEAELAKEKSSERLETEDDDQDASTSKGVESFQEISTIDQETVPEIDTLI